uniref:NADH-ubiquinone oxidoreductase chain 2 n=1 Tax=Haloveloides sundaensis TaxID=3095933 RepID=A0AB38Z6T4_9HEMI|nr:NADH dehydrogenase subunit 2 [Haloveloides sundaensis]WPW47165.1 NADH dehydrogenase subunit 2 [Haloveloides sundaensis]
MKISTKIMALMTLILSTMIIISSENWFSMWMGLEINMLSFIPILKKEKSKNSSEAKMMYFLIQSLSSIVFLFTIIMTPTTMYLNQMNTSMMLMNMAMFMKMGMAPMHMWFINMMNKISWDNCLILMTWQKIGPMFMLTNMNTSKMMIMIMAIFSAMVGAIGGINQTSMKKILAFSSVNHMGWMFICMKYDNEMWIKYLIIYSLLLVPLVMFLKKNSINYINQMTINMKSNMQKMNIIIMMMSIGGLPPFIGFLPKWMVIQSILPSNEMITILILMMTSMITLFYYIRMISPIIMMNSITQKWTMKTYEDKKMMTWNLLLNMMLPTTMMLNLM